MANPKEAAFDNIRVRFAPSPTGSLHLGGVRTALYNYLLARKHGGQFIIRVEDTDVERNLKDAHNLQLADLSWLGLDWDEGPDKGGPYEPYQQSQRQEIYQSHARQLVEEGKAFYCFLTDDELKALHSHENRQIKSPHRDLSSDEVDQKIKDGLSYVIRFRNDHQDRMFVFEDQVHGKTQLKGDMVGDFVLIRSTGLPVYNFCCAIDDHLMYITHVLRGEEHLSNTLRQLMIFDAFGWEAPTFAHLSMILGANRKKLSKRDDSVALSDFKSGGYIPQALLNYVALLGWSAESAEEKLTLTQMVEAFDLGRVHKSPAMFDRDKLNWVNHHHLGQLGSDQVLSALIEQIDPLYDGLDKEWFKKVWSSMGHQFNTLLDVKETLDLLDLDQYQLVDRDALDEMGLKVVACLKKHLEAHPNEAIQREEFNQITSKIRDELQVSGRQLFVPIRVALIGVASGIELKLMPLLMSKSNMIARIEKSSAAS